MSEKSFQKAVKEIAIRHEQAVLRQERRKREVIQRIPQSAVIIRALEQTGPKLAKTVFGGGDVQAAIQSLMEETSRNREQLRKLLQDYHYPPDYLELHYTCPRCEDSGYIEGKKCSCLKELVAKYNAEEFNENSQVSLEGFDTFSLRYYSDQPLKPDARSPRQTMQGVLDFCLAYAARFQPDAPSVLMIGETGLGKTHLSLAIAAEVMKKGYSVLYTSSPDLFRKLQNEYYGKGEADVDTMELLLQANLVILDDLGAEMENQFTAATLYHIVNFRLNAGKPMIISTNLSSRELERRYSSRVASRLLTMYKCLKFAGRDIRQLKLKEGE